MRPGNDLLDVNVWLALSSHQHSHRSIAEDYWQNEASNNKVFCRITMLGLLRMLGNSTVMSDAPLSAPRAWDYVQSLYDRPDISFVHDFAGTDAYLSKWVQAGLITPRIWTDAYLAALATSRKMRIVTFDHDFKRFEGLDLLLLKA